MRFLNLRLKNFLSFGDDEQELDLANRGLTLIEGENRDDDSARSNGAGKSSLLHAWLWVLFGKTLKEDVDGDEVVHRFKKRNCRVSLAFEDDAGTAYRIVRYRQDSKYRNAVEIYKGKVNLTERSAKDTQSRINTLVGMDFTSFAGILCGQGVNKPFSKLTDSEMKTVIDRIAGLGPYSAAGKVVKDKLAKAESERSAMYRVKDKAEVERATARDSIRKIKAEIASAKKSRTEEAEKELANAKAWIAKLTADREIAAPWEADHKKAKANLDAVKVRVTTMEVKQDGLRAHLTRLGHAKGFSKGVCESCGATIEPGKVDACIEEKRKELLKLDRSIASWGDTLHEAEKLAKAAEVRLTTLRTIDASLKDAEERLRKARTAMKRTEGARTDFDALLASAMRSREVAAKALGAAERQIEDLDRRIAALAFWTIGYGNKGIKSLMLDSVVPLLNRKVARYSSILTNGNMRIWFETQSALKGGELRDNFAVRVDVKKGGASYAAASGGEATKVDLCVSRAFQALLASRNRSALNVIFLDEIFDGLDEVAVEQAVNLVTEDLNTYESVFIITHRPDLKVYVPNSIKVIKEKGVSRIE